MKALVPKEVIENKIILIRGRKVIMSVHLAKLYEVETRALNQAVKRNADRFPQDFMFRLTNREARYLVSQSVIPHGKYFGGSLPYAFAEQGVAMLSSLLNSKRAVQVNIAIMRAFVKLRRMLSSHRKLASQLGLLENKVDKHDAQIRGIFDAIRRLMTVHDEPKRKKVGFLK
ncbi:MAG: hypothetical protein CVU77_00100 [Elusimicrobia bacterium HGW-Elusimicrobia-1]|jgi:hypothetical protein|nr:MAG: hypothetical protein CVU77_00100 [Elusimicrobia bacterium HGW-Elusimicrobia-1]